MARRAHLITPTFEHHPTAGERLPSGMRGDDNAFFELHRITFEDCSAWLEFAGQNSANETKWRVVRGDGVECALIWGRARAEKAARDLDKHGNFTR